jgi:hypothetical protein
MVDKRKPAKEQVKFCKELMDRLAKAVYENTEEDLSYWGIHNHTQISNDIVRLRRELNILNKMMYPWD